MFRWLAGLGARDYEVADVLSRVTQQQWDQTFRLLPFLAGLGSDELDRLRHKTAWFLASKRFSAAHELELTDEIMLSIAVQASVPILNLDTTVYEGWTQIIVYPGAFLVPRTEMDEAGVIHEYIAPASGEAWDGGPVILSWDDVEHDAQHLANVVIHEFAHKLDLYNGQADGIPVKPGKQSAGRVSLREWRLALRNALEMFRDQIDQLEQSVPSGIDSMSGLVQPWYDTLPMDPYAATDEAEFFAVSSEVFFVDPLRLESDFTQWYFCLSQYYEQDPATRFRSAG